MADDFDEFEDAFGDEEDYQFEDTDDEFAVGEESQDFGLEDEATDEDMMDEDDTITESITKKSPLKLAIIAGAVLFAVFILYLLMRSPSPPPKKAPSQAGQQAKPAKLATPGSANPASPMGFNQQGLGEQTGATGTTLATNQQPLTLPSQDQAKMNQLATSDRQQDGQLSKFDKRLTDLEKQTTTVTQKFSDLEKQNAENTQRLNQLSNGMMNIQNEVMKLNGAMHHLVDLQKKQQAAATAQAQRPAPPRQPTAQRRDDDDQAQARQAPEPPRYFVQAIIPGRAWLTDSEGKTITVTVGDKIHGFGAVTNIDPQQGVVKTSTGTTIEYGVSEY